MKSRPRLAFVAAALLPASCYATYDRGMAAANARDWPRAEAELWRYQQGAVCVGKRPELTCKQAAVLLGEVMLEDGRPPSAARVFRFAQRRYFKKAFGSPEVDRDLDDRIVNGLVTAKQRWNQYRSGVSGECQLVARYRGPSGLRLVKLQTELDMERIGLPNLPAEVPVLFDKVAAAGPHEVMVFATYVDPARPGFWYATEASYHRSCEDGERIEIVFQDHGPDASHGKVDVTASGGKPLPLEGPLRPNPGYEGP
jgi:hypothetical protein